MIVHVVKRRAKSVIVWWIEATHEEKYSGTNINAKDNY